MSRRPNSDTEIATALREHLPVKAQPGLRALILTEVEATSQLRRPPVPLDRLVDADPRARRRVLLLVAALLAASLGAGALVGSMLQERDRDPIVQVPLETPAAVLPPETSTATPSPDHSAVPSPEPTPALVLDPPADLAKFVLSTYSRMPKLPPMTITTIDEEGNKGRILVDGSGATRIETFASPDDTEPDGYRIYAGSSVGFLVLADGKRGWYQQKEAIGEDPRVFVYATMGGAGAGGEPDCEVSIGPDEVPSKTAAQGWKYEGAELVAGRPAHHVSCGGGELWIDVDTRLTLRSRSPMLDNNDRPIAGLFNLTEATAVDLGQPPKALFRIRKPAGAETLTWEEYQCAVAPDCPEPIVPVVTPPPASGDLGSPPDVDQLITTAKEAVTHQPAFAVEVETSESQNGLRGRLRVYHDGSGRYRIEDSYGDPGEVAKPGGGQTQITLAGDGYHYYTELLDDGTVVWRSQSSRRAADPRGYPLKPQAGCSDHDWTYVGVDSVLGRPADHVRCSFEDEVSDVWIDRQTDLVVLSQTLQAHDAQGTDIKEVTDLVFLDQPAELFELPPGVKLDKPVP